MIPLSKHRELSIDQACAKYLSKQVSQALSEETRFKLVKEPGIFIENLKLPFGIRVEKIWISRRTTPLVILVTALLILGLVLIL